jgi:hypothetical protein
MKTLTIIIEESRGVFLGIYSTAAIFSKTDPLENTKAYGFKNKQAAKDFVGKYLPYLADKVDYIDIPTDNSTYVDAIDIIRAGHSQHATELFMNMPTNATIH